MDARAVAAAISARLIRPAFAGLCALAAARSGAAQAVQGRVLDEATGAPLPGAVVSLLADTLRQASALTDTDGRFSLALGGPGTYRVRIDRSGYLPFRPQESVTLGPGETIERTFRMPLSRAALREVRVTADAACRTSGIRGDDVVRVWEQVRAALAAADVTTQQSLVTLELTVEEGVQPTAAGTRLRIKGGRQPTRVVRSNAPRAFVSPTGHDYATLGFRIGSGDSLAYLGPDADVALSDGFLASHCFRVVRSGGLFGRGRRLGLAFTPLDSTRGTFLRGTMWLDEPTARLEDLTYEYVVPGWRAGVQPPRGAIAFAPLPSGAWIVRDWRMEIPVLARPQLSSDQFLAERHVATYEKRGRTRVLTRPDAGAGSGSATAVLRGTVLDTLGDGPVADALVLVGGQPATRTNALGRYALTLGSVPREGATVVVEVADPLMRRYLADSSERIVLATPGDTVRVDVASPDPAALLRRACPQADAPADTASVGTTALGALFVAITRQPGDTTPLTVRAEWIWRRGSEPMLSGIEDRLETDGVFLACPVATDRPVSVAILDAAGERWRARLPTAPRRVWSLRVALPPRTPGGDGGEDSTRLR